ncbi:uncharacterized protein LOC117372988 [Periophthalmus magnuspinnatus]|uniref:uncharacterized protein LOC117372988 n=1 Tax=Periophthalmus magnuspinnatus TaxID=409849 RepID=UPI00145A4540|nr:uncharacterized protein LOC117372988 [Periophthalmus magnuspinnatus]
MAPCGVPVVLTWALLLLLLFSSNSLCSGPDTDTGRGRAELQRLRIYAVTSRYGDCWTRALEQLDTRCRDMTSESQSRMALKFTHCHLLSSGRDFPDCPEGSEVSRCTAHMDVVAFNTYTEFFTHTHSMCHFLQSEVWQNKAENTMHRLTESSLGVAEQLESTRQMAEDLIEAQSVALQAQQEILTNGEELRTTLKDSTQGLRSVFLELSAVSQQQQLALSELFNRVSFLQNFLMMEAHSMSSCLYNAAALGATFLLTTTSRTSRARLLLSALVCINFYLERKIYQFVTSSDLPEHQHMEVVASYISVLRCLVLSFSVFVLIFVILTHKDPLQQSLIVLQQLQETQRSLQVALQHAENLGEKQRRSEEHKWEVKTSSQKRKQERIKQEENVYKSSKRKMEDECPSDQSDLSQLSHIDSILSSTVCSSAANTTVLAYNSQDATLQNTVTHDPLVLTTPVSPSRRWRRSSTSRQGSSGSPLVYSIMVEDKQCRYSLRSRRSETPKYFD